jgi:hypothetical protein
VQGVGLEKVVSGQILNEENPLYTFHNFWQFVAVVIIAIFNFFGGKFKIPQPPRILWKIKDD